MTKSKQLGLVIVIPVYNEEQVVRKVINSWLNETKSINCKILVIDDGSKDKTLNNLKKIKSKKLIIKSQNNAGHGKAIIVGYKNALKLNPKFIFQVDSDNQFSTKNFKKFWKQRYKFDFQLGYRYSRYDPFHRLVLTRILRITLFLIFGVSIYDSNIPYRLMEAKKMAKIMKKIDNNTNAPNIFISILFYKNFRSFTNKVIHKKRKTGQVFAVKFKLLKFLVYSFFQLVNFSFKNLKI